MTATSTRPARGFEWLRAVVEAVHADADRFSGAVDRLKAVTPCTS